MYPSPLLAGFNPDPSIVRVCDDYYLATSTFEYLPGLPIYHSRNLTDWQLIGHVLERPAQIDLSNTPTAGGAWAPTLRFHDGLFYLIVTIMFENRTIIYTAADPTGPWSDGVVVPVQGIDPDIAWDESGDCYMTWSALDSESFPAGHNAIMQVQIDAATGALLETPRKLWAGSGGMYPEGPHVYKVGDEWVLVTAEGGTDRGHLVGCARGPSIKGPFIGAAENRILTAASSNSSVQNKGHGDLVELTDGSWAMVFLGVRVRGLTSAFSPLGRETFITPITWVDGWPKGVNIDADDPTVESLQARVVVFEPGAIDPNLISPRRFPGEIAQVRADGSLEIAGNGQDMGSLKPEFIGKRIELLIGALQARVSLKKGTGGLSIRSSEESHFDLTVSTEGAASVTMSGVGFSVEAYSGNLPSDALQQLSSEGGLTLWARSFQPPFSFGSKSISPDQIAFGYTDAQGIPTELAVLDGRGLTFEVADGFTGRVGGAFCVTGSLVLHELAEIR